MVAGVEGEGAGERAAEEEAVAAAATQSVAEVWEEQHSVTAALAVVAVVAK